MKRSKNLFILIFVFLMPFLFSCSSGEKPMEEQIRKDAQTFAKFKCELSFKMYELSTDSTSKFIDQKLDSLKMLRAEQIKYYKEKYSKNPEQEKMFKKAIKEAVKNSELCKELIDKYNIKPKDI